VVGRYIIYIKDWAGMKLQYKCSYEISFLPEISCSVQLLLGIIISKILPNQNNLEPV